MLTFNLTFTAKIFIDEEEGFPYKKILTVGLCLLAGLKRGIPGCFLFRSNLYFLVRSAPTALCLVVSTILSPKQVSSSGCAYAIGTETVFHWLNNTELHSLIHHHSCPRLGEDKKVASQGGTVGVCLSTHLHQPMLLHCPTEKVGWLKVCSVSPSTLPSFCQVLRGKMKEDAWFITILELCQPTWYLLPSSIDLILFSLKRSLFQNWGICSWGPLGSPAFPFSTIRGIWQPNNFLVSSHLLVVELA